MKQRETIGDLRVVRADGSTFVNDEDGDLLFVLPGEQPTKLVLAVERIRRVAQREGEVVGRASLQRDTTWSIVSRAGNSECAIDAQQ